MAERRQIKLHPSAKHLAHLDHMAREAKVHPGTLARSMLETLLDDDAKAHTEAEKK